MQKLPERPPFDWNQPFTSENVKFTGDLGLQKDVAIYNHRYLSWDELKYRIPDFERRKEAWAMMKLLRVMCYEHIPFKNLSLKYSLTHEIVKNLHTIDSYLSGTLRLHNKTISLEKSYIVNSLMEEAIASSILEGAATTRKMAKDMLIKGKKPKDNSERMVLNNYEAIRFIGEKKDESLSRTFILEIQQIVTKGTIEDAAVGHFRVSNDIVVANPQTGIVYHTPPDFLEIENYIKEICIFANSDDSESKTSSEIFIHPIIKGIILHYLIGYIHPFNDGNGRTARSIFYWYVLSRGYWLFEYMPISRIILRSKTKYTLAYLHTEYDESDLTYFLQYNLSCIEESIADLLTFLGKQQRLQKTTKALVRTIKEINPRQANILRNMMEHSDEYFSIGQVMHWCDIAYQTARTDLLHLRKLGYILQEKRGREFMFIFNEQYHHWKDQYFV